MLDDTKDYESINMCHGGNFKISQILEEFGNTIVTFFLPETKSHFSSFMKSFKISYGVRFALLFVIASYLAIIYRKLLKSRQNLIDRGIWSIIHAMFSRGRLIGVNYITQISFYLFFSIFTIYFLNSFRLLIFLFTITI